MRGDFIFCDAPGCDSSVMVGPSADLAGHRGLQHWGHEDAANGWAMVPIGDRKWLEFCSAECMQASERARAVTCSAKDCARSAGTYPRDPLPDGWAEVRIGGAPQPWCPAHWEPK